jgi:hypothetical protein
MAIFNSYVKLPEGIFGTGSMDLWIYGAPDWRYFMLGGTDNRYMYYSICNI